MAYLRLLVTYLSKFEVDVEKTAMLRQKLAILFLCKKYVKRKHHNYNYRKTNETQE